MLRRELLRVLTGAPVALLAAPALVKAGIAKLPLTGTRSECPESRVNGDPPSPEHMKARMEWFAWESAKALMIAADPTFKRIPSVIPLHGAYEIFGLEHRTTMHHLYWIVNVEADKFFDDTYMLQQILKIAKKLAGDIELEAVTAQGLGYAPKLIAFCNLPVPIPGLGALGGFAWYSNVGARAILSYDPHTLGHTFSIDTRFGLI